MKAINLLKYLDLADSQYVEEASDHNLLMYRKRRKRTRTALAATFLFVALAGVFLTKPALYAWETRNTVVSWRDNGGFKYFEFDKPSVPIFVSAEMPDRKKFSADTPFTLSVGLGQVSDYEYATLSVKAHGFEITDKDGNTVTDRYVRTLSDFDSEDYGVLYRNGKPTSPVTGCQYLEDFTFRFTGSENTTGWGVIEFSLQSRTENSSMGDYVTVYYTIQNGVLKLTDKNPVRDGNQNGGLGAMLEETETPPGQAKTVELSHEGYTVTVSVTNPFLVRGEAWQDKIDINVTLRGEPCESSDFMITLFPKDPVTGEVKGHIIRLMLPRFFSSMHDLIIPADAPLGSYDLVVTWFGSDADDEEDLPRWVFENFVTVTEPGTVTLSKEDFSIRVEMPSGVLNPGQLLGGECQIKAFYIPTQKDYSTDGFTAELVYAESKRVEDYSFFIHLPAEQSVDGFVYYFVPAIPEDAPIGSYDLRVTDPESGFVWVFENMALVLPKPPKEDPDFGTPPLYEDLICEAEAFKATLMQGEDFKDVFDVTLMQNGEDMSFFCKAELVYAGDGGEVYAITVQDSPFSSQIPASYIPVDAPAGEYDLVVTDERYGYTWWFNHIVEILPSDEKLDRFVFSVNIEDMLTVSRSSGDVFGFKATIRNRGKGFMMHITPEKRFEPEAVLVMRVTGGESPEIPLRPVPGPYFEPYDFFVHTDQPAARQFELIITPDTPCGLYDLALFYGDCVQIFEGVVEVVP
ncbi:MAG: hypothetical protein IJD38_13165 [Clostridia bacterium]|nr:hypothetical protein [Clostridia bacterium]